ncbi:MAG: hypothetical protein NVSMB45_08500 [Ginsengibacter sp.]
MFIVTNVDEGKDEHPATVVMTLYEPAFDVFTLSKMGFCNEDEKLFGPDQVYDAALIN